MKEISINQIVSPTAKQPFTARSLKFLQDYEAENYAAMVKAFITQTVGSYSLTVPYVISGCVVTDSNKDVTAGEIFYGGKFYETTAVNGATNVAQFILTKTQDATADPIIFTDSSSKNVHDIYTYVATDVASGGDFDATDLVSAYGDGSIVVNTTPITQSATGSYVDLNLATYTTPNDGVTRNWIISYEGFVQFSTTGDEGGVAKILSGATTLREAQVSANPGAAADFVSCLSISKVVSVPPNTIVKVQIKYISSNASFTNNNFSMVEV